MLRPYSVFLGLDLTSPAARPTAAVALRLVGARCSVPLRIAYWGSQSTDADIIDLAENLRPACVAIDAPLSLPPGLHCLEPSCPCSSPQRFRSAERELHRLGFGLFYTTKKSLIKRMVYRGVALKAELARRGHTVLEVYPYATKVRLWGRPIPKKDTHRGLEFLRGKLGGLMPCLSPYLPHLTHDMADALLAAYTAYLYSEGKAEMVGSPDEPQICIPRAKSEKRNPKHETLSYPSKTSDSVPTIHYQKV